MHRARFRNGFDDQAIMKRGVKRVRRFSIVCLIGIVGFACSKSNPFDTPRQLAGEVFIVTAEQQTIKLPLVEVIAVPADEMRRSIESGVKKFSEQEAQF